MSIKLQVIHNNKQISLSTAIENGYVKIHGNEIKATNQTSIALSSKLFDCNGNELYENDIVKSIEGKKYKIIYNIGMFYLFDLDTKAINPIYIFKIGNKIDVEKVIK